MNLEEQKKKTFSIARSVSPEVLREIRVQLDRSLVTGGSFEEFSKQIKLSMKVES